MAHTKTRRRRRRKKSDATSPAGHAFWSGSLTFGLVNVRVLLFPASRHRGVRLRLLGPDGSPLERRFFCPSDGRDVRADEIVRGYELDDGSYVTVTDRELEALEPQKSREIDLREFVDIAEVAPAFLERGYYLTPQEDSTKAYRLLADVMERTNRAGIATFVMRDREYLIAIFSRKGILCAETLRFVDEIRKPEAIGLPKQPAPDRKRIAAFGRAIDALYHDHLSITELADADDEKLRKLIDKKQRAGEDIVKTTVETEGEGDGDGDVEAEEGDVDLLDTIRRSLRQSASHGRSNKTTGMHLKTARAPQGPTKKKQAKSSKAKGKAKAASPGRKQTGRKAAAASPASARRSSWHARRD